MVMAHLRATKRTNDLRNARSRDHVPNGRATTPSDQVRLTVADADDPLGELGAACGMDVLRAGFEAGVLELVRLPGHRLLRPEPRRSANGRGFDGTEPERPILASPLSRLAVAGLPDAQISSKVTSVSRLPPEQRRTARLATRTYPDVEEKARRVGTAAIDAAIRKIKEARPT